MGGNRTLALAGLMIVGAVLLLPSAAGGGVGANCSDYTYQQDAQADLGRYPGLDGNDNDGLACESLPSRPVGAQTPVAPTTTRAPTVATPTPTPTTTRAPVATTAAPRTFGSTGIEEDLAPAGLAFLVLGVVVLRFAPRSPG